MKAFFLVGATASGKSAVAQWIAERHAFDILSADSMLVYRGMDIGTAKPGPADRGRVRYWGLDLVAPAEPFSVGLYRRAALEALAEISGAGRQALVVGGTGLYVKGLTDGLSCAPGPDPDRRAEWEQTLARGGIGALRDLLRRRSPAAFEALRDKDNPRRVMRALEKAGADRAGPGVRWRTPPHSPWIVGLRLPTEQLYRKIERRAVAMFRGGLLDEVRGLVAAGLEPALTARQAIGYGEALGVLRAECSPDEAAACTAARTKRLARRQMTWFRHQAAVRWIDIEETTPVPQVAERVLDAWRQDGPTPIADDSLSD